MRVMGLYAGKAKLLVERDKMSAIDKKYLDCAVVEPLGLVGDEQADLEHHGGPRQALHQFSEASYAQLQTAFVEIADKLVPGAIGENITISDMSDDNVYLGDVYQIGSAVKVRVTRPRRPCWKVDTHFGIEGVTKYLFQRPITGWYYEVLNVGTINVGDHVSLISRETDALSVGEAWMTKQFEK